MAMMNGHLSEPDGDLLRPPVQSARSESELSELNDAPLPQAEETDGDALDDDAIHDMGTSELDDDADAPGEVDDDYDAESPAPAPSDGMRHDRSASEESLRPGKRKAEVDEEDFMQQNPELYGLRRSVSALFPACHSRTLTLRSQGRARPTRQVVRAPHALNTSGRDVDLSLQVESSDEDDDEDDVVNTGRRRKRQKTATGRPCTSHTVLRDQIKCYRLIQVAASTREEYFEQLSSHDQESAEDETYGGQRGRTFAKKHRQLMASSRGTPQLSEVRFSTRRAAKVTNYNEDENMDEFEEDDDTEMTPNYYYQQEDLGPGIDLVLNHRLKDGVGTYMDCIDAFAVRILLTGTLDSANADKHDYEFQVCQYSHHALRSRH
jgi:chromodomain-helicase-DNA-binding protein 1